MEIGGVGVDLVDVDRVRRLILHRPTFAARVFTSEERNYCERGADPAECYAARWAAREACRKALGGIPRMRWRDVRVSRLPSGAPALALSGSASARAERLGVTSVLVALTHERTTAAAFCLALRQ